MIYLPIFSEDGSQIYAWVNYAMNGSDNSLLPFQREAITWTNYDLSSVSAITMLVKFESSYNHFHIKTEQIENTVCNTVSEMVSSIGTKP